MIRRPLAALALSIIAITAALPGCGLELAALASVSKAGSDAVGKSKVKSALDASGPEVYEATIRAQRALQFKLIKVRVPGPNRYRLTLEDHRGTDLRIKIDQRTPRLSRIVVDFGLFGHDPTGRLFLSELVRELEAIRSRRPAADPAPVVIPTYHPEKVPTDPYSIPSETPGNSYDVENTGDGVVPAAE